MFVRDCVIVKIRSLVQLLAQSSTFKTVKSQTFADRLLMQRSVGDIHPNANNTHFTRHSIVHAMPKHSRSHEISVAIAHRAAGDESKRWSLRRVALLRRIVLTVMMSVHSSFTNTYFNVNLQPISAYAIHRQAHRFAYLTQLRFACNASMRRITRFRVVVRPIIITTRRIPPGTNATKKDNEQINCDHSEPTCISVHLFSMCHHGCGRFLRSTH